MISDVKKSSQTPEEAQAAFQLAVNTAQKADLVVMVTRRECGHGRRGRFTCFA